MSDIKYLIAKEDIGRPDLISYKVYGTVKYSQVVLSYNEVYDPFTDLKVGTYIYLPQNPIKYGGMK